MATLRFEPIAMQLGKLASATLLFPADALERIRQGKVEGEPDPAWSAEVREFMGHYMAVVRAAHLLLGAPPFERLGRLHDELTREYQPGGPPKSPVYDSHMMQHVLGGVPQGLARETPYTVLARLSSGDPARARLQTLAEQMATSHLDLYRITQASGRVAELALARDGQALSVHATGPFLRDGDLVLARVVAFGEGRFIADSPYLLEASERDWLAYFERVADAHAAQRDRSPASGAKPSGKAQLSSKQAARRRKEQQLKAAQNTPSEAVVRHLRHGRSERFWLDYIVEGYAGERRGIARLAGVPDRPETLPHGTIPARR
jgi:hypothetical protein